MFNEVKSSSSGWAVIYFTHVSASDVNTNNKVSNKKKEQKENACSQTSGPSGHMW